MSELAFLADLPKLPSSQPLLERRGSWLRSPTHSWQMVNVVGPLEVAGNTLSRQYFKIETSNRESLLVFRQTGEKGMRSLFLCSVSALSPSNILPFPSCP